jgi:UDP-N-acetylmuramyl-tripeptide synthetase
MLKSDSRKIIDGDTFIAIKGIEKDGHDYIEEAIKKGANKIIAEYGNYSVDTILVNSTKEYLDSYLKENMPPIKIIGVTGTNGKTTTCYLIWKTFKLLNIKCAYIGTLGFYLSEKERDLDNTTPGGIELYELIKEAKFKEYEYIVMETSSQALDQGRLDFIEFDYAIFTNLTQDHLDYHKTMENYVIAKRKLFTNLKENGVGIINLDDPCANYFEIGNYVTYGYSESDYQLVGDNQVFKINEEKYEMNILGKYNIYNMSAAICLFYQLGYNHNDLKDVVILCDSPVGRMDLIKKGDNKIIIDYAHTPDAMENILNCVSDIAHSKIITIIGCGGNRDKTKRPIMGSVATKKSDYVIFTSDNPRDENPDAILLDITKELDTFNYEIEPNREIAIKKGIQFLMKNDILLVLGKGHETCQIIRGEKIFFDDKKIVLENI